MKALRLVYPVELEKLPPEDGGGWLARLTDFAEAATQGETREEVLGEARDLLEELVAHFILERKSLPLPSSARGRPTVTLPGQLAGKAALWLALSEEGVSLNELARRLGQSSTLQIRRLLDPRHSSRQPLLDRALSAVGKRLVTELVDA